MQEYKGSRAICVTISGKDMATLINFPSSLAASSASSPSSAAPPSPTTAGRFPSKSKSTSSLARESYCFPHIQHRLLCLWLPPCFLGVTVHARKKGQRSVLFAFEWCFSRIELLDHTHISLVKRGNKSRILTFRFTPRSFFSPSSFLSNFPILAVLVRVVASVLSISPFRTSRGPAARCARATFCSRCFSFLAIFALRSSRATFLGSWSTS